MFSILEIKSRYDLTWEDLPYIESPVFAHEHAVKAIQGRDPFTPPVQNLEDFRRAEVPHYDPLFNHDYVENHLRRLFFEGQYFSVSRPKIPLAPIFKWNPLAEHPDGGEWIANPFNYSEHCTKVLEDYAKQLGVQKRRKMAEQAEAEEEPIAISLPSASREKAEKNISAPKQPERQVNPELEARAIELIAIGKQIRSEGFFPTSDEEIHQRIKTGDLGNSRYLVSIQKSKKADEPIGFRRKDTGRTTMWTTTYDMIKKGDLSAPLLMALLGSSYNPADEYTMYIFDQGENFEQDGALTFSPTWENMQKFCPEELHMDDPEDPIHDKALLTSVMNPETQTNYQQTMESFWPATEGIDKAEYNEDIVNKYLAKNGFSDEESDHFKARHLYRTQIGANAYFQGNGATEFTLHEKNRAAIAADGICIEGDPGKSGVPEMLTIEKDPPSIEVLEREGVLKAIPLKRISV
jgi:hypothetical protein